MSTRYTEVVIDKPRRLRYTIATLQELERDLGCGLKKLFERDQEITTLVKLIYYGAKWDDPRLTETAVTGLLQNYIDADGDASALYAQAVAAVLQSGVFGREIAAGAREVLAPVDPPPPAAPGASSDSPTG